MVDRLTTEVGGALVAGASSGIGAATSLALASRGIPVVAVSRNPSRLQQDSHASGVDLSLIDLVCADLTQPEDVDRAFSWAESTHGPVKYVVHSVGFEFEPSWYDQTSPATILDTISALMASPALVLQRALKSMEPQGRKICIVSSGAAKRPTPGRALYSTSKIAVNRLVESVAAECSAGQLGTAVFAVLPGRVDTPMQRRLMEAAPDAPDAFQLKRFRSREGLLEATSVGTAIADQLMMGTAVLNGRIFRYRSEGWQATNE